MASIRNPSALDDPEVPEGDLGFAGFRSRVQATQLPAGVAAFLGNMRCDSGTAQVRKGTKAVATDLELVNPPLILDFELAPNVAITSITRSGSTATVTTTAAHGYSTGDTVAIEGATETEYNGDVEITVTGASTFTYAVTGTPATPATGTITANAGPLCLETYDDAVRGAAVTVADNNTEGILIVTTDTAYLYREGSAITEIGFPAGEQVEATDACALRQYLGYLYIFRGYQTADELAITSINRSSTTATVVTAAAHGLETGDWVTIDGGAEQAYKGIFSITKVNATTFSYEVVGSPTTPASGTNTARPCKPALRWDRNTANDFVVVTTGAHPTAGTLIRMPAVDWAIEFNTQLILPWKRDQLIRSDLGDADAYDKQYSQLRIRPGGIDWLIGSLGYQQVKVLVLYRKSVHLVTLNILGVPINREQITDQIGCVARETLANCGDFILWLSDQGVQSMSVSAELTLRTSQTPLSEPVDDIIRRITWANAEDAQAIYWNNRYYIALPLDGGTKNNRVLVYNFLNREWESLDSYPEAFDVRGWCVMNYQGQKRLHAVTSYGFIFVMEVLEVDEYGNTSVITDYVIPGRLVQRDLQHKTKKPKRYRYTVIEVGSTAAGDAFDVTLNTRNPDRARSMPSFESTEEGEATYHKRARGKGTAASIEINTTAGRPEIRSILLEATTGDRSVRTRE